MQIALNNNSELAWETVASVISLTMVFGVLICVLASFVTLRRYLRSDAPVTVLVPVSPPRARPIRGSRSASISFPLGRGSQPRSPVGSRHAT